MQSQYTQDTEGNQKVELSLRQIGKLYELNLMSKSLRNLTKMISLSLSHIFCLTIPTVLKRWPK